LLGFVSPYPIYKTNCTHGARTSCACGVHTTLTSCMHHPKRRYLGKRRDCLEHPAFVGFRFTLPNLQAIPSVICWVSLRSTQPTSSAESIHLRNSRDGTAGLIYPFQVIADSHVVTAGQGKDLFGQREPCFKGFLDYQRIVIRIDHDGHAGIILG